MTNSPPDDEQGDAEVENEPADDEATPPAQPQTFEHMATDAIRRARREIRKREDGADRSDFYLQSARTFALLELAEAVRKSNRS